MFSKLSLDQIKRHFMPGLVVRLARDDRPARIACRIRRRLGRKGRVELYFAFDDPNSAVAVIDLAIRLDDFDVTLDLRPVINRGIPDDPAVEDKRRHAIDDARRLFKRSGLTMVRTEPIRPETTAFLAEWVAAAPQGAALSAFCVVALRRLWLEAGPEIDQGEYAGIWEQNFNRPVPVPHLAAVKANEKMMKRRGPFDTPAAWVHGQWFFAHDRLSQIAERLNDLGWKKTG